MMITPQAMFGGKPSIEEGMAFNQAFATSGYTFIRLRLINFKMQRMQAVDTIIPMAKPAEGGLTTYEFKKGSGQLRFSANASNTEMNADILDTEYNRRFLASHTAYKFWEIVDEKVRAEIQALADAMTDKAIIKKKETKRPVEDMSDEQLQLQIDKLTHEKTRRGVQRAESATGFRPEKEDLDNEAAIKKGGKGSKTYPRNIISDASKPKEESASPISVLQG
jgi:hypothetical protein